MSVKPIIAVTMGDPAGTGAELLAKALLLPEVREVCHPVVVGDAEWMRRAASVVQSTAEVHVLHEMGKSSADAARINVLDLANVDGARFRIAEASAAGGQAAYEYIRRAVDLTLNGEAHAVVTSAINKAALHAAGHRFDGHTELLAELCGRPEVTMMLVADDLRICHVSTHVSLREAIERVQLQRIVRVIQLAHAGVQELGIDDPRIAVAGLNPHAGEGGLFGDEDARVITPAVEQARALGMRVSGPYAGDTVFFRTLQREFDCAVAMYHDQGHVAAKMLGIWRGVNVTLGLPIIRTSVEHGTDFANAGTGRGDPRSLVQALKLAATMAATRLQTFGTAVRAAPAGLH